MPAHPLIVHGAVVLAPLLVVLVAAYALIPPIRRWLAWAVVALAVLAPAGLWLAKLSGDAFLARQQARLPEDAARQFAADMNDHIGFGKAAAWWGVALGALALLLVMVCAAAGRRPAAKGPRILTYSVIVLALAAAVVTAYYVVQTGHTGAIAVWEGL